MSSSTEPLIESLDLVSGDSHVVEPRNLWRDNLPPSLRSKALRGIKPGEAGAWEVVLEGEDLDANAQAESERMKTADPEHRYSVMREEGIVGECIFPTTALYVWLLEDPDGPGRVVSGLQRVDRRRAGTPCPVQVRRARAHVERRRRDRRGRVDRRHGPRFDHAPGGRDARLEPPHLGPAVVGHRGDRPARGDASGHRTQHVLLPGRGGGRLEPAWPPSRWHREPRRCWRTRACSSSIPNCTSSSSSTTSAGSAG